MLVFYVLLWLGIGTILMLQIETLEKDDKKLNFTQRLMSIVFWPFITLLYIFVGPK
jgi:hypothetical protein